MGRVPALAQRRHCVRLYSVLFCPKKGLPGPERAASSGRCGHFVLQRPDSKAVIPMALASLACTSHEREVFVANPFPHGTVHVAGEDLQAALRSNPDVLALWESLTPLGRNEFICWVEDAKQPKTRQRRIARTCEELLEGKRRPCCWAGCIHRTDKAPGRWQQAVLIDQQGKKRR